jgi:hypothetical protein
MQKSADTGAHIAGYGRGWILSNVQSVPSGDREPDHARGDRSVRWYPLWRFGLGVDSDRKSRLGGFKASQGDFARLAVVDDGVRVVRTKVDACCRCLERPFPRGMNPRSVE